MYMTSLHMAYGNPVISLEFHVSYGMHLLDHLAAEIVWLPVDH